MESIGWAPLDQPWAEGRRWAVSHVVAVASQSVRSTARLCFAPCASLKTPEAGPSRFDFGGARKIIT